MLTTLLESNAPRQRRRAGALASICIHTLGVVGAVVATGSPRPTSIRPEKIVIHRPVFARPEPVERNAPTNVRGAEGAGTQAVPSIGPIVLAPMPQPVTARLRDLDPAALLEADPLGRVGRLGAIGGDSALPMEADGPRTVTTVDRIAAILAPPRPRYPDRLRAAGITGRVIVRLVVDTAGRIEPTSVVIRESSHDLFTQAVLATLPAMRFVPAEAGGRRVRMLVDLPFEFRLHP